MIESSQDHKIKEEIKYFKDGEENMIQDKSRSLINVQFDDGEENMIQIKWVLPINRVLNKVIRQLVLNIQVRRYSQFLALIF